MPGPQRFLFIKSYKFRKQLIPNPLKINLTFDKFKQYFQNLWMRLSPSALIVQCLFMVHANPLTLRLLSTTVLSIVMYSEEMNTVFQCVYNACPLGTQPFFS